jgi:hypothetical protein
MQASGVVTGGWEFVVAAYSVTAAMLVGYALSIHFRYRAERERERRDAAGGRR